MAKIYEVALVALLPFSFAVAQQTITLNDGTQFQGRFVSGTSTLITFVDQNGDRHRFSIREIQSLTFQGAERYGRSDSNRPVRTGGLSEAGNRGGYDDETRRARANGGSYATLAAQTQIAVRTLDTINTREVQAGRTYPASIDRDVLDQTGRVVIPRGSDAQLVVRDAGSNQVVLDLQSVAVNGQRYMLNTDDVSRDTGNDRGLGANKRTGTYVGGGAVLGTLLGAIAGGGRGAAIGALAGAAAGAGTQVLTRGSEVKVPSETLLTFKLDQPAYLYR